MPAQVPDPFALPAFIIALVGLIIAVVAAVTGIASLWWQIVTRRRGAHNVKVTAKAALVALSDDSVTEWQVNVRPANVGASPVSITGWGFELPRDHGSLFQVRRDNISTPLPHLLEPGTSINLFMSQEGVRDALRTNAPGVEPSALRAYVTLGTGQTVYAKRGVPA
ncbi:hypothetical protein [Microbacterium aurantiacum]|uniref:Uncharacterized protein n=1 Tax=Microbacterium aurantiacum TaxID=162393 RepID=A0ABT8FTU2_9MICO|nr:hypothetical protein [Microbacterium aurantiacum]MDN4464724.1 hypothetical protein [Microbacterium aurantiacum]